VTNIKANRFVDDLMTVFCGTKIL